MWTHSRGGHSLETCDARARAYRFLLRAIDWAVECETRTWIDTASRDKVLEEFLEAQVAWKRGTGAVMVRHDRRSIRRLPGQLVDKARFYNDNVTVTRLFEKGSEPFHSDVLATIGYNRKKEASRAIASIYRHYQGRDRARKHLWSTFALDTSAADRDGGELTGAIAVHDDEQESAIAQANMIVATQGDQSDGDADDGEESESHADSDENHGNFDMHYKRSPTTRSTPSISSEKGKLYRQARDEQLYMQARAAIAEHLDQRWRGRTVTVTARQVATEIAAAYDIDYFDRKSSQFKKRGVDQYCGTLGYELRKYNATRKPHERKTLTDLVRDGSSMMQEVQSLARPAPPQRRSQRVVDEQTSPYVVVSDDEDRTDYRYKSVGQKSQAQRETTSTQAGTPPSHRLKSQTSGVDTITAVLGRGSRNSLATVDDTAGDDYTKLESPSRAINISSSPELTSESSSTGERVVKSRLGTRSSIEEATRSQPAIVSIAGAKRKASDMRATDGTVFSLEDRDLGDRLHQIQVTLSSALLGLCAAPGINDAKLPVLSRRESSILHKAYRPIVGTSNNDTEVAWHSVQNQVPTTNLAIAVAGSAFYHSVLSGETTPSLTFDHYFFERQRAFGTDMDLFNTELQACQTDFDTLMRRVYLRHISSRSFRPNDTLQDAAARAMQGINGVLQVHLHAAGLDLDDSAEDLEQWEDILKEAIVDALVLKCELSCAREEYKFSMACSGQVFNARSMMDGHGGGRETVLVPIFPGLFVEGDGGREPVRKMLVRTV